MQIDIPSVPPARAKLLSEFADPPLEYGLYPGWWWEGAAVCKEKLTWQLEEMKKVGTGGTWFYLRCSRDEPFAVMPAYRSEEFYDLFKYSLEEHRRLGMQAFFSEWTGQRSVQDEVLGDGSDELIGRRLVLHEQESTAAGPISVKIPSDDEVISAAAYRMTPRGLDGSSRLELLDTVKEGRVTWKAPEAGWLLSVVTSRAYSVDWLSPKVADRWLDKVYGAFLDKMPEFMGNTFKGYIQDELDVLAGEIVYSKDLLEQFTADKGYDPRPELVALFYDIGPRTEKIRCEYHEKVAELLEENVYARIAQWHERRDMVYGTIAIRGRQDVLGETGHFGDMFRLMRWYHFPGNEDPQLSPKIPARRRFIDGKLSSSAAHIFERSRVGLCAYWGAGWGMTMEQDVAWTNENYAYGMNLYDPHLASYSMGFGWYEWVPPSFYFYQPYWAHYKTFSDYVRRMSYIMSQGVHVADVALLFPTSTIHANWLRGNRVQLPGDLAACATFNMAESIYDGGIDFDFMDEQTLCQAQVKDGKLCVARMSFRAVALPPLTAIHLAILRKLKEFYDGGGVVLAYQGLPSASVENGRDDPEVRQLLADMFGTPSGAQYSHPTFEPPDPHEDHFISSINVRPNECGGVALFVPGEQNTDTNGSAVSLPDVLKCVMRCDVATETKDIYHTHQRVGDLDVYYMYNAGGQAREVTVTLRVVGQPELWDAAAGQVGPYHRFECRGDTTVVRLSMARHQSVILSFTPENDRPSVMDDNLTQIESVVARDEYVEVQGTYTDGGKKGIHVQHHGNEYAGQVRVDASPATITLDGEWDFQLEPTMDNRWGDFRYPAGQQFIGAEARRFAYMEEQGQGGIDLGWHQVELDDANWPRFTFSHGPYWYAAGPFPQGQEPPELLEGALTGEEVSDPWQRYYFSQRYGHESKEVTVNFGGLFGVSDYFMFFDDTPETDDMSRYLQTTIRAEQAGQWDFIFGCDGEVPRRAWVNGRQVMCQTYDTAASEIDQGPKMPCFVQAPLEMPDPNTEVQVKVSLEQGLNRVVLQLVQPRGRSVRAYAAFVRCGAEPSAGKPPIPRVKWFIEDTGLTYDVLAQEDSHVGWYRFEAPAGTQTITIPLDGLGIAAWVDGKSATVEDGTIRLETPTKKICKIALRVEQRPGCYAGAAIPEPVAFECKPASISLGDWCDYALESYSGGAVYHKQFNLDERHLEGKVLLDLGRVHTTTGVRVNGHEAGVGLGRPYCFDITEHVRAGSNDLEVTVYNTLANHYSIGIPSRFVYEGQTVSGLLGPVELRFPAQVTIQARPLLSCREGK